jgi:hypothetical protein
MGIVKMFRKTENKKEVKLFESSIKDKLDIAKKNNVKIRENNKFKQRKMYIICIISALFLIVLISVLVMYLNYLKFKPYIKYEEKMKAYGFDVMYDNKSAKTSETVTKAEALKLALAAVYNTSDISGFALENNEYNNAIWVGFAKEKGITNEDINKKNYMNKVKYKDVITYFENCKIVLLKNKDIKDTESKLKDITKYTAEEQIAIKDMEANNIISSISNKLNGDKNIFKGQLNELVVNFVEEYSTITMHGDKININQEKIPANADQYPYTLSTIDKSIYEKPFAVEYQTDALSPVQLYKYKKEMYPKIQEDAENFFKDILNINYNTITEEGLKAKLSEYFIFEPNDYAIKKYVENVKNNQIIIEGSAKLLLPIIYCDGMSYRIRIQVTFDVKSSKTKNNLIYLDYLNGLSKTYEKNSYDFIADYYMSNAIGNNNIYMNQVDLYNSIIDKEKSGITQEIDTHSDFKEGNDASN